MSLRYFHSASRRITNGAKFGLRHFKLTNQVVQISMVTNQILVVKITRVSDSAAFRQLCNAVKVFLTAAPNLYDFFSNIY